MMTSLMIWFWKRHETTRSHQENPQQICLSNIALNMERAEQERSKSGYQVKPESGFNLAYLYTKEICTRTQQERSKSYSMYYLVELETYVNSTFISEKLG